MSKTLRVWLDSWGIGPWSQRSQVAGSSACHRSAASWSSPSTAPSRSTCWGPVEVFEYAERQVPGAYRIDVVGPGADGRITMGNGLRLGVEPLPGAAAAARHARRRRWPGRAPRDRGPGDRRLDRARVAPRAAHDVGLHGLVPARRRGPAGRPPRDDALGVLRRPWPSATPRSELDPDPVFVRDGDVWTSAGVTAGMDLALALVEDDLGAEVALAVARLLVVFLKRPGGQSQFSGALSVQQAVAAGAARAAGVDRRPSRRGPLGRGAGRPRAA